MCFPRNTSMSAVYAASKMCKSYWIYFFGFCAIHSEYVHLHLCMFIHSFSSWNFPTEKAWWMMTQPWHVLISLWADYASNLSTHNISHPTILHIHTATHFSRVYSVGTWLTNINNLEPNWVQYVVKVQWLKFCTSDKVLSCL